MASPCEPYNSSAAPSCTMDTATLVMHGDADFTLWMQSAECFECPLIPVCQVAKGVTMQMNVDTTFPTNTGIVLAADNSSWCKLTPHFGECGVYNFTYQELNNSISRNSCIWSEIKSPQNAYMPILVAFFIYLAAIFVYVGSRIAIRKYRLLRSDTDPSLCSNLTSETQSEIEAYKPTVTKQRVRSLDTFRGISIVIMIFVNYGGGGYYFFEHSAWNGLTVADLVFPWFMFIMGTSMAFAFQTSSKRNTSRWSLFANVCRRSVILFGLGIFLNSHHYSALKTLRIPGVLQRFGISYFVVGTLRCLPLAATNWALSVRFAAIRELVQYWVEWIIMLGLTCLWLGLTFGWTVPGCTQGYIGPGGIQNSTKGSVLTTNCTGGVAGYIDRVLFGEDHIYQTPTCKYLYETTIPYDPEGLLGCLTAILITYLGLHAGQIMITHTEWRARVVRWFIWGAATGLIAGVLCKFSQNDGWIPVNKNLWSLSFVLSMASMAYILLGVLYWIIDVRNFWNGAPFYQAGMNSILLYIGHELFEDYLPFSWQPLPNTHAANLAEDLFGSTVWTSIAVYLDYKKTYFSI